MLSASYELAENCAVYPWRTEGYAPVSEQTPNLLPKKPVPPPKTSPATPINESETRYHPVNAKGYGVHWSDVVHKVAMAWDDMISDPAYVGKRQRVFSSTGITAQVDGRRDHLLSQEIRTILEDTRGSNWNGEKCDFLQWRPE